MKTRQLAKIAAGALLTLGVTALAGLLNTSPTVQAQDNGNNDDEQLIRIGYAITPVPLNLEGKNRDLVGLGSFIVNAQADCNGCHTAGGPPNFNYANSGNPYFLNQPLGTKTDPTAYLAGGTPFGQAVPSSASVGGFPSGSIPSSYPPNGYLIDPTTGFPYAGPIIISRNLTPDKNGRPAGGHTLEQFKEILRTGKDFDNIHNLSIRHRPQHWAGHLHSTSRGRQQAASHAMADISQHDRPSNRSYLRVSERNPLHRQYIQFFAGGCPQRAPQ